MALISINPATGHEVKSYPEMSERDIDGKVRDTHDAYRSWKKESFARRSECLKDIAGQLTARAVVLARLMAEEMGKPVKQGLAEIEKCSWVCRYYAERAEGYLADETVETDASRSYVHFEPLGVVLAVMPWNFPFWQVFRGAAPALMAGNGMLLKHASNVTGCATAIQEIFNDSRLPDGLFETLLISTDGVARVIKNEFVSAVTLTGSTPAGQSVATTAGSGLKKCVLELGGSDPYLILADADLESAAKICAASRMINTGQSCVSAKRFIAVKEIRGLFESRLIDEMKKYAPGDPLDENTMAGPLARIDLRDSLHDQVRRSIKTGAKLVLGGRKPKGEGAYYPPTVLSGVKKGMPAYHEELFGPVAGIIEALDEKDAVNIANDSCFGLGAAVFTRNNQRGERIAAEGLEAGLCFVNSSVKSDPRLPFGGIKQSGYGRELGIYGIREFVNTKTVYIQ